MRYVPAIKKTPAPLLPAHQVAHEVAHQPGTLAVSTSLFHHISTVVGGRKELADITGRTKSLIDQQITGVKNDPMAQCRKIIRGLIAHGYKEMAELVAQEVANELKAVVFTEENIAQLTLLASKAIAPKEIK